VAVGAPLRRRRRGVLDLIVAAVVVAVAAAGVLVYLTSELHLRHDPQHALQQLDALYLDERPSATASSDCGGGAPRSSCSPARVRPHRWTPKVA
jgi:hypothetical protein